MTRQARIVLPGYLHHITQRGNYRQKIFQENKDFAIFLKYLEKYSNKYGVEIFAYCLMSNHIHLVARPKKNDSFAKMLNLCLQRYSIYFNKKNDVQGHLWQSRYFSCIAEGDYICHLVRYVEKNPVRANLVKYPWEYIWSSVHFHLGKKYESVKIKDIKEYINVKSWKEFLMEDEELKKIDYLRKATQQGVVIGSEKLVKKLENKFKRVIKVRNEGRPSKKI